MVAVNGIQDIISNVWLCDVCYRTQPSAPFDLTNEHLMISSDSVITNYCCRQIVSPIVEHQGHCIMQDNKLVRL
jgi:hypothetical protein